MCGIAGIWPMHSDLGPEHKQQLERMTSALEHRGPDDQGYFFQSQVALGHRRLSILDTSEAGRQPMFTPDQKHAFVFNGESYNYREVRKRYSDYPFGSDSDSEVVLCHLAHKGIEGLADIYGMFAFAFWDKAQESLLIVRDRLGEKPLYYMEAGGNLYFASEVRALIASGAIDAKLCPQGLEAYLAFGALPDPLTIFAGVKALRPGQYILAKRGGYKIENYWEIPARGEASFADREECKAQLLDHLTTSVQGRALSDVPLGSFLSGGVDSGAVTALLAADSSVPVQTFSIAFQVDQEIVGELDAARDMAKHIGASHNELILDSAAVSGGLSDYVSGLDQPHSDSINTFFVSRFARSKITVALSGLGGDELFAGYTQFWDMERKQRWGKLLDWVPAALPKTVASMLKQTNARRWERFAHYQHGFVGRYASLRSLFDDVYRRDILQPSARSGFCSPAFLRENLPNLPKDASLFQRVSYLEMKTYMQYLLLMGTDNSSMACGLEVRVPFLDHKLVEFAAGVPDQWKYDGQRGKAILQDAVEHLLPAGHLNRPKQGFVFPLAKWLKTDLQDIGHEVLSADRLEKRGILNPQAVGQQWQAFLKGDRHVHFKRIWSLIVLELWLDRYL